MPGRRECRVATSCLDPLMTNEPVPIVAGGVVLAGNEGKGVTEGAYICLPYGTSANIQSCPPDTYSSLTLYDN